MHRLQIRKEKVDIEEQKLKSLNQLRILYEDQIWEIDKKIVLQKCKIEQVKNYEFNPFNNIFEEFLMDKNIVKTCNDYLPGSYCLRHNLQCSTRECFKCMENNKDAVFIFILKSTWHYIRQGCKSFYECSSKDTEEFIFCNELKSLFDTDVEFTNNTYRLMCPGEFHNNEYGLEKNEWLKLIFNKNHYFPTKLQIPSNQKNQWKNLF